MAYGKFFRLVLANLFWFYLAIITNLLCLKIIHDAFQAMKLFSHDKVCFEKLVKCAMLSLSLAGGSDSGASVSSAIVGWYLQRDGVKHARKMYKRYGN